jgi:TRAP-type C4-dicarboxylate transport system permease small subunit
VTRFIDNFEEVLGAVLVAVLCIVVCAEVVLRYALTHPLSWTEEFATIVFIYVTMLGSSMALKRGEHFAVELLRTRVPPKAALFIRVLGLVIVTLVSACLLWYGILFAARNHGVTTPAMHWPRSVPYAAIPLGGALMMIRSLQLLARLRQAPEVRA